MQKTVVRMKSLIQAIANKCGYEIRRLPAYTTETADLPAIAQEPRRVAQKHIRGVGDTGLIPDLPSPNSKSKKRESNVTKQLSGDTEKPQQYLREYEKAFDPIADREIKLLELGMFKGGSLLMWRDYFPRGTIIGLDINVVGIDDPTGRIHTYFGRQEDTALLTRIAREQAPDGFDIIVDDCSHLGELTRISFWHLFENHLKPGGIYAIEDWGTGYFGTHETYPDGRIFRPGREAISSIGHVSQLRKGLRWLTDRSIMKRAPRLQRVLLRNFYISRFRTHDRGMVGFIKQLVDECGMLDLTNSDWGKPPQTAPRISHMIIRPGLVIVFKEKEST